MRMFSSAFDSPHGLMNKFNYSTAYDVCLLASKCMTIPKFREVVRTQTYKTQSKQGN